LGPLALIGFTLQFPGQLQWVGKFLDVTDWASISSPAVTYVTKVELGELRAVGSVRYNQNQSIRGVWTQGNRTIVPSLNGNALYPGTCSTPDAPSVTCTNVYIYPAGLNKNAEWDEPFYQIAPFAATVSE
jgi:hypothetical protein